MHVFLLQFQRCLNASHVHRIRFLATLLVNIQHLKGEHDWTFLDAIRAPASAGRSFGARVLVFTEFRNSS